MADTHLELVSLSDVVGFLEFQNLSKEGVDFHESTGKKTGLAPLMHCRYDTIVILLCRSIW